MCQRLERRLVAARELDDARPSLECQRAHARSRGRLAGRHAAAKFVSQRPPPRLPIARVLSLLASRMATANDASHRFDRREHIVGVDVAICMLTDVIEQRPEALESLDLDIHTLSMRAQDIQERGAIVLDDPTDVREREPEVPQGTDLIQALDIVLVVEALPPVRARGRDEQSDVVVVMKSTDGQPGCPCQFADAPGASSRRPFHRGATYNLTSRQVQAENATRPAPSPDHRGSPAPASARRSGPPCRRRCATPFRRMPT
jgi:hypothetical protein